LKISLITFGLTPVGECTNIDNSALDRNIYANERHPSIDKTDSTELSEAINSMYHWYKGARVCYAYLADVPNAGMVVNPREDRPIDEKGLFRESRWFTRGWTLQELVAPNIVEFYAADCEFT